MYGVVALAVALAVPLNSSFVFAMEKMRPWTMPTMMPIPASPEAEIDPIVYTTSCRQSSDMMCTTRK